MRGVKVQAEISVELAERLGKLPYGWKTKLVEALLETYADAVDGGEGTHITLAAGIYEGKYTLKLKHP